MFNSWFASARVNGADLFLIFYRQSFTTPGLLTQNSLYRGDLANRCSGYRWQVNSITERKWNWFTN